MFNLMAKAGVQLHSPSKKWGWFVCALMIVAIDQLSKYWVVGSLSVGQTQTFLPYFNFTLLHNPGAAFSFLADQGGWQRIVLSIVALLVSVLIVVWILCIDPRKRAEIAGLTLVLGGAVGNLWDRVSLGYVVDFFDWFYVSEAGGCLPFFYQLFNDQIYTCHWPAFNIADASILGGAALLILDMIYLDQRTKQKVEE